MASKREDHPVLESGASAAAGGGLLAGVSELSQARPSLLKAILKGAGIYGGLGAGSTAIGLGLMGTPDADESSGYTRRGALGGAVGGGLIGGGLGALAGSGRIDIGSKAPEWLAEYASKLKSAPNGLLKGAAVGAAGLGGIAALLGGTEGTTLDALKNEMKRRKRVKYGVD